MKSKAAPVTLKSLAKLINEKFDGVDKKFIGIYGELDEIKEQIRTHRNETQEGFNGVYDGISQLAGAIDHDLEPRIKHLEDQKHFPSAN